MSKTWNDAITSASHCKRYINGVFWEGIAMVAFEEAHKEFKALAKQMRRVGYQARIVTIAEGSIGITGTGANLVKRSVLITPRGQVNAREFVDKAQALQEMYW